MHQSLNVLGQPVGDLVEAWQAVATPDKVVLMGQYCALKPLSAEHKTNLYDAFSEDVEGRIWSYLPVGPFVDFNDYSKWFDICEQSKDPQFYAIVDKSNDCAIGIASFMRIDAAMGVVEVGYINYSPSLQNTSMATEAMYLMMKYVFDDLGYRRYEWKCNNHNAGSKSAALRLGFSFEGIFRQAAINKGRNRDTAWFSILDHEWPDMKQAFEAWLNPDNFDQRGQQKKSLNSFKIPTIAIDG